MQSGLLLENLFRDSKLGAALRHLPSGYPQVNLAWMWGALLAASMAAWLHQLTARTAGEDIVHGHGVRGGKAMIATLRWRLIAVPGRLVRHARHLVLRLPPGHGLLHEVLTRLRDLPAHVDLRFLSSGSPSLITACRPRPAERPADREPGAVPGPSACPPPGILPQQDHLRRQGSARRAIRGFGSEQDAARVLEHLEALTRLLARSDLTGGS